MKLDHLLDLNRQLKSIFYDPLNHQFPVKIEFNEGMEHPSFKITVEKHDTDIFVDSSGQKWRKVK